MIHPKCDRKRGDHLGEWKKRIKGDKKEGRGEGEIMGQRRRKDERKLVENYQRELSRQERRDTRLRGHGNGKKMEKGNKHRHRP